MLYRIPPLNKLPTPPYIDATACPVHVSQPALIDFLYKLIATTDIRNVFLKLNTNPHKRIIHYNRNNIPYLNHQCPSHNPNMLPCSLLSIKVSTGKVLSASSQTTPSNDRQELAAALGPSSASRAGSDHCRPQPFTLLVAFRPYYSLLNVFHLICNSH